MGQICGCMQIIGEGKVGIKETSGKFDEVLEPGAHCVNWCAGKVVRATVTLGVQQVDVKCQAKTKDNVFVTLVASIMYQVAKHMAHHGFYKLTDPRVQIRSFMSDVLLSTVLKMSLDEVFEKRSEISSDATTFLRKEMSSYGFEILRVLLVEIIPDEAVKRAMNEVKSAGLLKEAALHKAETQKILEVKRAEAKCLAAVGLSKSLPACLSNVPETARKEILDMIVVSQYFDTMREIGVSSNSSMFLVPHVPGAVHEIAEQIRNEISRSSTSHTTEEAQQ